MRSLDQERAAFAWKCIEERFLGSKEKGADKRTTYCNLAKSAPALVMGNGLMQTLAFFEAKACDKKGKRKEDAETGWLNDDILRWLAERVPELGSETSCSFRDVMAQLHSQQSEVYQRATEEAMELLRWLRQLAPALGSGEGGDHAASGAELRRD